MFKNIQAIVIKSQKFNDCDVQLVLLSRELGKIQIVAWGAQRKNSGLMSYCQLLNLGILGVSAQPGKPYSLRQAQCECTFASIKKNNLKLAAACFFVEALGGLMAYNQSENKLFDLLKGYLYAMDLLDLSYWSGIQAIFMLHLIKSCGYGPNLFTCSQCNQEICEQQVYFSPQRGGVLCKECGRGLSYGLSPRDLKQLQEMEQFSFRAQAFPQEINKDILIFLETYLFFILQYQPKSFLFYKQIRGF